VIIFSEERAGTCDYFFQRKMAGICELMF